MLELTPRTCKCANDKNATHLPECGVTGWFNTRENTVLS